MIFAWFLSKNVNFCALINLNITKLSKKTSRLLRTLLQVYYEKNTKLFQYIYSLIKNHENFHKILILFVRMELLGLNASFLLKYFYNYKENKQNGEFDLVTYNGLTYDFYECKFKNHVISKVEVYEEINQIKKVALSINKISFISKLGIEDCEEVNSITLLGLYNEILYKYIN